MAVSHSPTGQNHMKPPVIHLRRLGLPPGVTSPFALSSVLFSLRLRDRWPDFSQHSVPSLKARKDSHCGLTPFCTVASFLLFQLCDGLLLAEISRVHISSVMS